MNIKRRSLALSNGTKEPLTIREAKKTIALHEAGECEECFEGECMDEAKGIIEGWDAAVKECARVIYAHQDCGNWKDCIGILIPQIKRLLVKSKE